MKKKENNKGIYEQNSLLLEIIRQNTSKATDEFKNNTLCLSGNITAVELGEIINKSVSEIIAFF